MRCSPGAPQWWEVRSAASAGTASAGGAAGAAATIRRGGRWLAARPHRQRRRASRVGVPTSASHRCSTGDAESNEPTGYSIELTKLMMAELGAEIEYVEIPFSELFAAGEAGRFDLGDPGDEPALPAVCVSPSPGRPRSSRATTSCSSRSRRSPAVPELDSEGRHDCRARRVVAGRGGQVELPERRAKGAAGAARHRRGRRHRAFRRRVHRRVRCRRRRRPGPAAARRAVGVRPHNTYFMPKGDFPLWAWVAQFLQFKASRPDDARPLGAVHRRRAAPTGRAHQRRRRPLARHRPHL